VLEPQHTGDFVRTRMRGGPCNPGLEPQMAGLVEPWVRSSWVCSEYLQRGGFVDTLVCQLPVDSRAAPCVGESTLRCPPPRRARRARTHMADVDAGTSSHWDCCRMFVASGWFTKSCGRADRRRINAVGKPCVRIHASQVILCDGKDFDIFTMIPMRSQWKAKLRDVIPAA
jgi:hypothetical protein